MINMVVNCCITLVSYWVWIGAGISMKRFQYLTRLLNALHSYVPIFRPVALIWASNIGLND